MKTIGLIIIGVLVIGGGVWYYLNQRNQIGPGVCLAGQKLIDGKCKIEESQAKDEISDWQTYRNKEYGYEMKYPKNWKIEEARIVDPEGINPTESVVCFGPQDKVYYRGPGTMSPICVEISTGALEQYRKIYPEVETGKRKEMTIGTYSISVEERAFGEIFYIFENPTNKNILVTIRDSIGMITIADIVEENDLKNIFNQILSTFKFID